jgi:hypothetical protein
VETQRAPGLHHLAASRREALEVEIERSRLALTGISVSVLGLHQKRPFGQKGQRQSG